jgi:hypothetical protein
MRSDVNYSHSKNIGEAVGSFCELPIRSYDNFALELDVALDVQRTVLRNQAMGCSDIPTTAEILPGEVLCADNIIRRTTTAEAVGYDTYMEKRPTTMLIGASGLVRNDNDEWVKEYSGKEQSTPEELCAALNAMPKRSFVSKVEVKGEDKNLCTYDSSGKLLYTFRYVGGLPGTYIGGDEARLLAPPQTRVGINSPSRVIQYLDNGNTIKVSTEPIKEYADEWACTYIPTSHVERITVGGTALFAPEELV